MFAFLNKNGKQATAVVLKHVGVFHFASQFPFKKIRPDTEYMS